MKHRDGILDLVRGISALLVMLGHLRAFLFIDYADAGALNPLWKGFYLITGLGHQAVMVFFVLSGYFVGGSVLSAMQGGGFTWHRYAIARLSRLWTVLIPAMLLTLVLDMIGRYLAPGAYSGLLNASFCSGPTTDQQVSLGILTFLGNLCFIQTIATPVYGSNGPLWSLANEFWYYVLFPLLATSIAALMRGRSHETIGLALRAGPLVANGAESERIENVVCGSKIEHDSASSSDQKSTNRPKACRPIGQARRAVPCKGEDPRGGSESILNQQSSFSSSPTTALFSLALATAILFWLPAHLSSLGLVWLMGVLVWWIAQRMKSIRLPLRLLGCFVLAPLFVASLLASKTGHWAGSDWMVGGTFSLWMLNLLGPWKTPGWWSRVSTGLSEISYTLYVVHFPILFFFAATVMSGKQLAPGTHAAMVFAGLAVGTIALSALIWWMFERNTPHVRRIMQALPFSGIRSPQTA